MKHNSFAFLRAPVQSGQVLILHSSCFIFWIKLEKRYDIEKLLESLKDPKHICTCIWGVSEKPIEKDRLAFKGKLLLAHVNNLLVAIGPQRFSELMKGLGKEVRGNRKIAGTPLRSDNSIFVSWRLDENRIDSLWWLTCSPRPLRFCLPWILTKEWTSAYLSNRSARQI